MLVLGVKEGDYLMVGDDIMIRVMQVDNQFRLAFDAPKEISIRRSSVYEREQIKGRAKSKPSTSTQRKGHPSQTGQEQKSHSKETGKHMETRRIPKEEGILSEKQRLRNRMKQEKGLGPL